MNPVDPSEWTKPNPHWYWKKGSDSGDEQTVSVTADASVNGVSIGSVSAEKKVKVWTPYEEMRANGGDAIVEAETSVQGPIVFHGAVGTQDLFREGGGGYGTWEVTQLCNINRTGTNPLGFTSVISTDDLVLDSEFNYASKNLPGAAADPAPWPANSTADLSNEKTWSDAPEHDLTGLVAATCNDTFNTYMLYMPPGIDSQWVPLHLLVWTWNVNISTSGGTALTPWQPYPPGTVTVQSDFDTSSFPTWSDSFNP